MQTKTVLELDLVGYSSIARIVEQNTDAESVVKVNTQIQDYIDQGLRAVGLVSQDTVMTHTGDGAIIVFDGPAMAHRFAREVHSRSQAHNKNVSELSAKRLFRMGAATGQIIIRKLGDGGSAIAGTIIADAVRLEAASGPGEILIDNRTFDGLEAEFQAAYGSVEKVSGKRDERYDARRCIMDPEAAAVRLAPFSAPRAAAGEKRRIIDLFEQLYPVDLLDRLIYLVEMPAHVQPSQYNTYGQRYTQVLMWASSAAGCGCNVLESELVYLIENFTQNTIRIKSGGGR